ncbi:sugar phosphorylase [Fictibacillus fluitans]|uniref:Sucrose phosphorylase n=1 Tax=Fictibacillus fluitans TaxID=3058422 RepID=A0ABT8HVA1_9BACL|nr:sugar phosphorylase [Fictibacillus sp. NE201]MDN4524713.1 sugar phosphorylase [Fictibacillus sp. NE201]
MNKQQFMQEAEGLLMAVYGKDGAEERTEQLVSLVQKWKEKDTPSSSPLSQKNVYLITYGDSIQKEGISPLAALHQFLNTQAGDEITDVHLLPMFPYTSDDGFSVVDYREINPELGSWEDISRLSDDFHLMFDFVANHISKSSSWFKGFLKDDPLYRHYFIPEDSGFNASSVVRPRTTPLFHSYNSTSGKKTAWTTFSEDQVDVNFSHFPVLLEMTDILLMYADRGGTSIRLDAIGFLWKKSGTACIHLPETHAIIQLWRLILDYLESRTQLITETNVPHKENISYLGDGENEAHMVYQFPLPPLVLHAFTVHETAKLSDWARSIEKVSDHATYFNFLASHDGIGMRPTEGILGDKDRQLLVDKVKENGGRVSYKSNPDGTESPYELNINYMEALLNKGEDEEEDVQIQKMLAAHSVLFSFIGVPAVYYHSLLGSGNDLQGVEQSCINRRINREKLDYDALINELETSDRRRGVFGGLKKMMRIRQAESAFSPFADQKVKDLGPEIFALERWNKETDEQIFFAVNTASQKVSIQLPTGGTDLWTGKTVERQTELEPYQFIWVKPQ